MLAKANHALLLTYIIVFIIVVLMIITTIIVVTNKNSLGGACALSPHYCQSLSQCFHYHDRHFSCDCDVTDHNYMKNNNCFNGKSSFGHLCLVALLLAFVSVLVFITMFFFIPTQIMKVTMSFINNVA